ncbi:hypothetical protein LVO79_02005 [Roseivivax marinus]|nr:hypothetical protein [Roseivivax marinus]UMA65270.1 hypothetical protein LVO79_02005 [Roseivivax marinus]
MQVFRSASPRTPPRMAEQWLEQLFAARTVRRGGVVRRATRDVERMVGRRAFREAVRERGFHLVECGDQFVVLCSTDKLVVHF